MGTLSQLSTADHVNVYRDGELLTSGDYYIPGEQLIVTLHSLSTTLMAEHIYEAHNATFSGANSGCNGTRIFNVVNATLTLPSGGSGNVVIKAGFV